MNSQRRGYIQPPNPAPTKTKRYNASKYNYAKTKTFSYNMIPSPLDLLPVALLCIYTGLAYLVLIPGLLSPDDLGTHELLDW